jgi:hypothetical protein
MFAAYGNGATWKNQKSKIKLERKQLNNYNFQRNEIEGK